VQGAAEKGVGKILISIRRPSFAPSKGQVFLYCARRRSLSAVWTNAPLLANAEALADSKEIFPLLLSISLL
jgi:hypothetical protein